MKTKLLSALFLGCLLLSSAAVAAQENIFNGTPLVREGNEWFYYDAYSCSFRHYIKGDTVLNGIRYKKLYEESPCQGLSRKQYVNEEVAFMREENGRVYVVQDTIRSFATCGTSTIFNRCVKGEYYDLNQEWVLYDFGNMENYISQINNFFAPFEREEPIHVYYVEQISGVEGVLDPNRPCYAVYNDYYGPATAYARHCGTFIEGVGFVTDVNPFIGDLISYQFFGTTCLKHNQLVYLKNAEGEYLYLDEKLMPSGIALLKHSDLKVSASNGHISISLPDYVNYGMIEVIDINGRVVKTQYMTGNHADLHLKDFVKGMYIVQFRSEGHIAVQKVML